MFKYIIVSSLNIISIYSSIRSSDNNKQSENKEVIQPLFNQPVCILHDLNILVPKVYETLMLNSYF